MDPLTALGSGGVSAQSSAAASSNLSGAVNTLTFYPPQAMGGGSSWDKLIIPAAVVLGILILVKK